MYPQSSPYGSPWQPQPYGAPPAPRPPSRTPWLGIIAGIVAVLLVVGGLATIAIVLLSRTHKTSAVWSDADSPVPVSSADPTWGDRTAPVTLVVFGDLQDPFCAHLQPTVDSLKTLYGPSTLRVVFKNDPLPFHTNAKPAAEAAVGVLELKGSDAFWHFQERAFANQHSLTQASFEDWASESSVDMPRFRRGLSTHKWQTKVEDDAAVAKTVGVTGTPTSYVNGIKLSGVQTLAQFQHVIDDELPKVRLRLSSGSRPDRIYVERSKDNIGTSWPPPAPSGLGLAGTGTVPTPSTTSTYAPPTVTATIHRVAVGTSPVLGKKDALVTLVEFADFQCPFCLRAETTLAALRAEYGDKLRIVWKNNPLPFHIHAVPAAELALEARDEKGDSVFWRVHDDIYASQRAGLEVADLVRIAHAAGVNESKVRDAIATGKHQPIIDADASLSRRVGATGTPTFFVNGRMISGAQSQATFEAVIDAELKRAEDRVAHGTKADKVYDAIMAEAVDW